jgi:lipopolysaccharide transport system ATP-binding protein
MEQAIIVENLSKIYRRYHTDRPSTLQEAVLRGLRRIRPAEQLYALKEIYFNVPRGEMLGIIGQNGAGKSTLLRLIGGVGRPNTGSIEVRGRIGAMLDLGAGFHPELTGRENVFISGVISGLTRREVIERFDSIVAFAELEAYIDRPLRTFSSGMQMRLAFAVAVHIDAEVLLIDEVLAVGDAAFQQKCLDRIGQFTRGGRTGILVSHDLGMVKKLCDQALWLQQGQIIAHGPANVVVDDYLAQVKDETERRTPADHPTRRMTTGAMLEASRNRFGSFELEIRDVSFCNASGKHVSQIESGDSLQIDIAYVAPQPIQAPIFDVTISREDGLVCFKTDTLNAGLMPASVEGSGVLSLQIDRLDLEGGRYYVDVGAYERDWAYAYDYHWRAHQLEIASDSGRGNEGLLRPPNQWRIVESAPHTSMFASAHEEQTV